MIFHNLIIASVVGLAVTSSRASAQECTSVESITCSQVSTPPTLDGSTDDWTSVDITEAPLTGAMNSIAYPRGNAKIRCVHDTNKVYFLFEIPGLYRFDTEDNHMCAAVSSMFKMGEDAKLFNMGGCPLALTDCPVDGGIADCDDYKVDIGGHWELKTTEQGVYYGTNDGTGDDSLANKDDEYAVSPWCRMDDDDVLAANEWEGAWLYVNATDGADTDEVGTYVFEMARSLKTKSDESDKQLEVGEAEEFGFAFWDPYEREDGGWTDAGHYVTGCSEDWISLRLVDENGELDTEETSVDSIEETSIATANGEETSTNDGVSPSTADSSSDAVFVSYLGLTAASLVLATYCLY